MNLTLFLSGFWHGHNKMLFSKQFVFSGVVDRNPTSRREMVQVSVTSSWGEGRRLYVPCECQSCLHRPFFSTRMRELTALSTFSLLRSALCSLPHWKESSVHLMCLWEHLWLSKFSCSLVFLLALLLLSDRGMCQLRKAKSLLLIKN